MHQGCGKDADAASRSKTEGNKLFQAGQYAEAAKKYTEALRSQETATAQGRVEAATVYSNRSICVLREGAQVATSVTHGAKPDDHRRSFAERAAADADAALRLDPASQKVSDPTTNTRAWKLYI